MGATRQVFDLLFGGMKTPLDTPYSRLTCITSKAKDDEFLAALAAWFYAEYPSLDIWKRLVKITEEYAHRA